MISRYKEAPVMVDEDPVPLLSGSLGFFSSTYGRYPQDDISILNLNHRHTIYSEEEKETPFLMGKKTYLKESSLYIFIFIDHTHILLVRTNKGNLAS